MITETCSCNLPETHVHMFLFAFFISSLSSVISPSSSFVDVPESYFIFEIWLRFKFLCIPLWWFFRNLHTFLIIKYINFIDASKEREREAYCVQKCLVCLHAIKHKPKTVAIWSDNDMHTIWGSLMELSCSRIHIAKWILLLL